jgi:hypothetical protein
MLTTLFLRKRQKLCHPNYISRGKIIYKLRFRLEAERKEKPKENTITTQPKTKITSAKQVPQLILLVVAEQVRHSVGAICQPEAPCI